MRVQPEPFHGCIGLYHKPISVVWVLGLWFRAKVCKVKILEFRVGVRVTARLLGYRVRVV